MAEKYSRKIVSKIKVIYFNRKYKNYRTENKIEIKNTVGKLDSTLDIAEEGNGDLVDRYKEITHNLVAR